jgi:hypothetical protein
LTAAALFFRGGVFFGRELDLDDFLQAGGAQLAGNADVVAVDAVLAFEIGRAGQNLLLVLEDGLDHLDGGRGGSVVGAAGLEMLDDLGAAVAGALDEGFEALGGDEFGDGNAGDGGVAGSGTMVSPWPPRTKAVTFSTLTFSSRR